MKSKNILLLMLFVGLLNARPFRPGEIPNGEKYSCNNCHIVPGGPRNDFGTEIENNHLDPEGHVIWSAALAALDSDGDGISNGAELLDPNGLWQIGLPHPGDTVDVTNPGDPQSFTGILSRVSDQIPGDYELFQNYPNPFNPETVFKFNLPERSAVKLQIYDVLGQHVDEVVNETLPAGTYEFAWNINEAPHGNLQSGVYFYHLKTENYNQIKRMILVK